MINSSNPTFVNNLQLNVSPTKTSNKMIFVFRKNIGVLSAKKTTNSSNPTLVNNLKLKVSPTENSQQNQQNQQNAEHACRVLTGGSLISQHLGEQFLYIHHERCEVLQKETSFHLHPQPVCYTPLSSFRCASHLHW